MLISPATAAGGGGGGGVSLNVDTQNKVALLVGQESARDDTVLAPRQTHPHIGLSPVLPSGRLGHALVATVVAPVHEKRRVQLLRRLVDPIDLEPDLPKSNIYYVT